MKKIKISIRRSAFFILMATAAFTTFSISALWIFTEIAKSKQKIAEIKASYISEQRILLKNKVNQVVTMIDFSRINNPQKTTQQLQDEILNYYSTLRINHGGYIFINKYNGDALVFDGVKIIGKKNIKNLTDPDGIRIFDAEMEAISNPDGGFFNYKFKKLNDTKPASKLSFVIGYNDWKWIIGAGIYLDDLNLIIKEENNKYQYILFKKILYIFILFSVLLLFFFVISIVISSFIRKEFKVFMSFLTEKPNLTTTIDYKKLKIDEFKQMARTANIAINKQRNTEELLTIERDKAHSYLDIADVIILALDKKGNITLINKKGWETIGYDLEYMIGKNWFQNFVPLSSKKILLDNFLNIMSKDGDVPIRNRQSKIITRSGDIRTISWQNTILYSADGNIAGSLSSGTDITEKIAAEKSLLESEEKYKLLFERTSNPVLIIGNDNTFIDCNYAAIKMLGLKNKNELIGLHPDKISPVNQPDGKLSLIKATEMITKAKNNGYHRFEWLHNDTNNNLFHVDISLTTIPIAGVEYIHVVWHDISDRKKQEEELIIAKEKAEQGENIKTSFLHNMHHEIRTPLNAIMGFSQLLKDGAISNEDTADYYDDIISSGNQLSKIIDTIIDFSKLQSGVMKINYDNIELNTLMSDTYNEYISNTQNKPINFIINTCPSEFITVIKTDVNRLKQVIGHLLSNAFKFTEQGSIMLEYSILDNEILFSVADTGVGIENKYIESIFEKFNRITHNNPEKLYGGSGLGLSISKAIILKLNGKIWVESEINKGSKFSFTLPYTPLEIDNNIQNKVLSNSNITVVTNDINYFNKISVALKETEANIIHIVNGIKAIEFCQNNFKTNIMIIDMKLSGMNGIATTKAIKAFNKKLPVIALCTNNDAITKKEKALAAGCNDYIFKNQNSNDIKLKLSLWIDNSILKKYKEIKPA